MGGEISKNIVYSYNSLINAVNDGWNDTYYYDSEYDREVSREDGAYRSYKTKADYAYELDRYRREEDGSDDKYGNYFNSMTNGMNRDQKVDAYLNGTVGSEDFEFDDGSKLTRSLGNKSALQSKGARYQLQEYLGETVEGYVKRRDESRRRDALRKQMLAEKDIIDGGKSKQQTTEGGLG